MSLCICSIGVTSVKEMCIWLISLTLKMNTLTTQTENVAVKIAMQLNKRISRIQKYTTTEFTGKKIKISVQLLTNVTESFPLIQKKHQIN